MKRGSARVDGVLLLDKPVGLSSNAALQRAKRLFDAAKAGHTGTLDPMASGLLPLCLGEATKFAGYLLDADKVYLASIQLGTSTTTGDAEGEIVFRGERLPEDPQQIQATLAGLVGDMDQVPPMYSALKRDGKPLYEYARAGQSVERAPRRIRIHALDALDALDIRPGRLDIRVRVSKGTYIRVLAEEIGRRLGCGAHLAALRREETGGFHLRDAVTLEALETASAATRMASLLPADSLLAGLPRLDLDAGAAMALRNGKEVDGPADGGAGCVRVYATGLGFVGLCDRDDTGRLRPRRLMSTESGTNGSEKPSKPLAKLEENS